MFKVNLFPQVVKTILKDIKSEVDDDGLMSLHSLFEEQLPKSLEYVDMANFTQYTLEDGSQNLIQVEGISQRMYMLFLNINYCTCPMFKQQVLTTERHYLCKHILGAWLALKIGKCKKCVITSEQATNLMALTMSLNDQNTDNTVNNETTKVDN